MVEHCNNIAEKSIITGPQFLELAEKFADLGFNDKLIKHELNLIVKFWEKR